MRKNCFITPIYLNLVKLILCYNNDTRHIICLIVTVCLNDFLKFIMINPSEYLIMNCHEIGKWS